jgi:5'-methylthioadenosine phosphorylase
MVTDYDVWHDVEEDVSVEVVSSNLRANSEAARVIVGQLVTRGLPERSCTCGSAMEHAIMTAAERIPDEARSWIRVLTGGIPGPG